MGQISDRGYEDQQHRADAESRWTGGIRVSRRAVLGAGAGLGLAGLSVATGTNHAAAETTGPAIRLAYRGRTGYQIYLGSDEDVVVQQAATELQSYLHDITSATFKLITAATPPDDPHLIVVGRRNPITTGVKDIDFDQFGDDGFALRTLHDQTVLIASASSRGTLYGAYWVLDHLLGVRWYAADATVTPRKRDLNVPTKLLNGDHTPAYRYRESYIGDTKDPAYRQHNLLNGHNQGSSDNPGIDTWSDYWPYGSFGGTFHTLVPDESLWAGGQLACMDPRTREIAAANLIDLLKKRIAEGDDPSYGFVQQDAGWTMDADSQKFADAHGGSPAAPITDMVNDVLSRVRRQVPNARLSSQAYQFDFPPPTGIRPSDGIIMTVAPIEANFAQSLFVGDNADRGADIVEWCKISNDVVLWDYVTTFANYVIPFPDWWAMCEGIQHLATLQPAAGLGYFGEGPYNAQGTEFSQLRTWLIGRLTWDPTLDADAQIHDFLNGYYGRAGELIYRYMRVMVQSVEDTSTFVGESVTETAGYLTFDAMRQADALLDQAESAVTHDTTLLNRVRTIRLGVDYVILVRTAEFQRAAAKAGVDWDPDTPNRLSRFSSELKTSGLTNFREGGGTPEQLLEKVVSQVYGLSGTHVLVNDTDTMRLSVTNNIGTAIEINSVTWTVDSLSGTALQNTSVEAGATVSSDVSLASLAAGTYTANLTLDLVDLPGVTVTSSIVILDHDHLIPMSRHTVDIDGALDDLSGVAGISIALPQDGNNEITGWGGPDDLSAQAWFTYDDDNFYFSARFTDDVQSNNYTGPDIWQGDCVQFALSAGLPGETNLTYEYGVALTSAGPELYRWIARSGDVGTVDNADIAVARTGTTTIYEVAVPWSQLTPIDPGDGLMSLSLSVNENDGGGWKGWMEWGGGIDGSKNQSLYKPVRFVQ